MIRIGAAKVNAEGWMRLDSGTLAGELVLLAGAACGGWAFVPVV